MHGGANDIVERQIKVGDRGCGIVTTLRQGQATGRPHGRQGIDGILIVVDDSMTRVDGKDFGGCTVVSIIVIIIRSSTPLLHPLICFPPPVQSVRHGTRRHERYAFRRRHCWCL